MLTSCPLFFSCLPSISLNPLIMPMVPVCYSAVFLVHSRMFPQGECVEAHIHMFKTIFEVKWGWLTTVCLRFGVLWRIVIWNSSFQSMQSPPALPLGSAQQKLVKLHLLTISIILVSLILVSERTTILGLFYLKKSHSMQIVRALPKPWQFHERGTQGSSRPLLCLHLYFPYLCPYIVIRDDRSRCWSYYVICFL